MIYKIYQIDFFSITIFYENEGIIINIIDDEQYTYEITINEKNLYKICIFNLSFDTTFDYYNFLIMCFENIEKYKIIILNKNYKFIRLNENNPNKYITINFEKKYFHDDTSLIEDHYNIINENLEDDKNLNVNYITKICTFMYKFFNYKI